jgi:prepilin-type N-terminal cleavage/methylation domain-containing protein
MKGFTLIELIIVLSILGTLSFFSITTLHRIHTVHEQFMTDCLKGGSRAVCEAKWRGVQ